MDIKLITREYRWRLLLTFFIIILDAFLGILFPFFIGKAIDGLLNQEIKALWLLGILGLFMILIGGARRLFDTRFYAKLYAHMSSSSVKLIPENDESKKAARLNMLAEMLRFAENELPIIIQHSIGLVGVMIIIAFLNSFIFIGSLICGLIVISIYLQSGQKTFNYNTEFNNELEKQVEVVQNRQQVSLRLHLYNLMKWNIKLSDIETINYSISWIIMIMLLMLSIYFSASTELQYGSLFALIMYVYQYIESMVSLPLYYQQCLRLKEINQRIKAS